MPTDPRLGSTIAGYRLAEPIGRGGMGVVYRAEQLSLGRDVALKLLREDLAHDPAFRSRFLRESRLGGQVLHPNLVPIYDAGEADGLLYIAMQYVRGIDLRRLIARDGALAPARAVAILAAIAQALDAAHARGLVHRDVKPANVLVVEHGDEPAQVEAYLSDFGLLKQISSQTGLTQAGNMVGTMAYIAPEQIQGRPVDGATDQYALGCVLFECLTGSTPFPREEEAAVLWAHLSSAPPALANWRPDLPAGLDTALSRALAKQPAQRFPSCREFLGAVAAAIGPQVLTGTSPPATAASSDQTTVVDPPSARFAGWREAAAGMSGGGGNARHDQPTRTATVPPPWPGPAAGGPSPQRWGSVPPGPLPPGDGRLQVRLIVLLTVLALLLIAAVASAAGDGGHARTAPTTPPTSLPAIPTVTDTTVDEFVTTESEETLPSLVEPTTTTLPEPPRSLRLPFTFNGRGDMQLPPFTAAGSWRLAWSYDCRKAEYSSGFALEVAPDGGSVNKYGTSQSGVEHYQAGAYALEVRADNACRWSLRATGPPGASNRRVPFTVSGSGQATTAPFTVHGGWDIHWSYRCPGDPLLGDFQLDVHPDRPLAVLDYGNGGDGVEHMDSGGTYFLVVAPDEECSWTVKVTD
jgi:hypothetical protein